MKSKFNQLNKMNASLKSAPGAIGTSSLGTSLLKPRRLLTGVTCPARSSILPSQRPHTNGFPCQTTFTRPVVAARVFNNNNNNNRNNDDFGDRILAALPFLLPLLDGLPYGALGVFTYGWLRLVSAPRPASSPHLLAQPATALLALSTQPNGHCQVRCNVSKFTTALRMHALGVQGPAWSRGQGETGRGEEQGKRLPYALPYWGT